MRVYLSGPITGVNNYRKNFEEAAQELRWRGYTDLINPAELCTVLPVEHTTYEQYMTMCMDLLEMADAVVLLPGWEKSTGANREVGYALAKDMAILDLGTMMQEEVKG